MQTLPIQESAKFITAAREFVSGIRLEKNKGYVFKVHLPGGEPYVTPPDTKYRASRSRLRTIFNIAGANAGGIRRLHPECVGQMYQRLLATMRREEGEPRKKGWKWSEEARERAAREREDRRLNGTATRRPRQTGWKWSEEARERASIAARERHAATRESIAATLPPVPVEAAADSALALATAHRRIAARFPSLPAASLEWLAKFAASPL